MDDPMIKTILVLGVVTFATGVVTLIKVFATLVGII